MLLVLTGEGLGEQHSGVPVLHHVGVPKVLELERGAGQGAVPVSAAAEAVGVDVVRQGGAEHLRLSACVICRGGRRQSLEGG